MTDLENIIPMQNLSIRQADCLRFIAQYLQTHEQYPTQREIANGMGIKSNTAYHFTEPLKKKEYLYTDSKFGKRNIRFAPIAFRFIKNEKRKNEKENTYDNL